MEHIKNRKLVFETGEEFFGTGFGSLKDAVCEIVFNTSMTGYQEIISDPSYTGQAVVMTYPLIGNYGTADEDYETKSPHIGGLIVREYNDFPSNFRYTKTLSEVMEENGIPGISGLDTRKLTRIIRDRGTGRVLLTDAETKTQDALAVLQKTPVPHDYVAQISSKKRWYARTANARYHVAAIDCGIKLNMIRSLTQRGCNVTVLPFHTTAEEIKRLRPDGILLSNGPGNPEDVQPVIRLVRELRGKFPIFGICLGHQMICLACGAETYKLKFGHRGGNHPVLDLETGKIEITSQNHSYAVREESLKGTGLAVTHMNLLDHTVEGVSDISSSMFGVQFHPESAPGPQDSGYLFDRFIHLMMEDN